MNLFKQFKSLIPTPPLFVGDVVTFINGTATVELPDGGRVQARGDAAIGDRVFVRDGIIQAAAPDLPFEIINV